MKVLLSQEELDAHCDATDSKDCPRGEYGIVLCESCAAKAQARHLLKVLNEPCDEHEDDIVGFSRRIDCPDCMAEIESELG